MNIGDIVETTHEAPTAPSTPSSRLQPSVSPPLPSVTCSTRALQQQSYHLPLPVREVLTRGQILLDPRPLFLPPQIISSQCILSIPPTASSSQTSARPTTQSFAPSWTQRAAEGVPTHEDLSLSMSWSHPRSHFRVRPVRAACGSCRKRKSKVLILPVCHSPLSSTSDTASSTSPTERTTENPAESTSILGSDMQSGRVRVI